MTTRISYKKRMATIWEHPNGVLYALWEENGRTRRKSLSTKDKRIAKTRLNHFQRQLIAGKVKAISEGTITSLHDFVDEYLDHVSATCSPASYVQYDVALRKAKSSWGRIPLNHITERHIDTLITDMFKEGLKVPTINKVLRHVKAALMKAYRWKYIKVRVEFPKMMKEEKKLRFLSAKQLRAVIGKITDPEFSDLCLFAAYTGLRSGEILRLLWSDVDNPEGFLRISPKQKNKTESRISINTSARSILERCKSRGTAKVFRFECLTWISQKFKAAVLAAGLNKDTRFHDLRHTFASHLAMAGVDLKSIQDLMRHESIASTMVYAKVSPEHLREASEAVNYGPMPVPQTAQ
ncbi:MAG: tyrosine-type recombinase/integrase [Syntrophales bacterium]|nr:tyrosine-type recombinase/integrase [Syntrophales bacterium]